MFSMKININLQRLNLSILKKNSQRKLVKVWGRHFNMRCDGCLPVLYLGVEAHPAAVKGVFAESWRAAHVILPRGCVDHLQRLIADRPVHTKVWCLARLPGLSIAYPLEFQTRGWNVNKNIVRLQKYQLIFPAMKKAQKKPIGDSSEIIKPFFLFYMILSNMVERNDASLRWGLRGRSLNSSKGLWPPLYHKHKWEIYGCHKSLCPVRFGVCMYVWKCIKLLGSNWQHFWQKMIYSGWNPHCSKATALHR